MMSIVSGEFNGQMAAAQAAAAHALGVQTGPTLIAANTADIYGLPQVWESIKSFSIQFSPITQK